MKHTDLITLAPNTTNKNINIRTCTHQEFLDHLATADGPYCIVITTYYNESGKYTEEIYKKTYSDIRTAKRSLGQLLKGKMYYWTWHCGVQETNTSVYDRQYTIKSIKLI